MDKDDLESYTHMYRTMIISNMMEWNDLCRNYTNFVNNAFTNWRQLMELTNLIFMKDIQKNIKSISV